MRAHELAVEVVRYMRRAEKAKPGHPDAPGLRAAGIAMMKADPTAPYGRTHFGEGSQIYGLLDALAECVRVKRGFAAVHPMMAAGMPKEAVDRYEAALTQALP